MRVSVSVSGLPVEVVEVVLVLGHAATEPTRARAKTLQEARMIEWVCIYKGSNGSKAIAKTIDEALRLKIQSE